MTDFAAMMKRVEEHLVHTPYMVTLNVGGTVFQTSKATLLRVEGSYFHALLGSGLWQPDGPGDVYFLDVDPDIFRHVLQFLRTQDVLALDDLSPSDHRAFMAMLEYLNLNNAGLQSFEWDRSGSSPRSKWSHGFRTVEAQTSRCEFARSANLLVGSCRVLVEYVKQTWFDDVFAIGVGPWKGYETWGSDVHGYCYLYRSSGRIKTPRGISDANHPALGRGDVVTIRRTPTTVSFSLNDGEPVYAVPVDSSYGLYPVVFMFQAGTRLTLLD